MKLAFFTCTLAFLLLDSGPLFANPIGGSVAAGSATIQSVPGTLTINQSSNAAIINWQSFSINNGELTQFLQPSASSAVLNRVLGGETSILNGTLSANGRVYLINGNGIVVGSSGMINTAGFVASTRDIADPDFISGKLHFTGSRSGEVQNLGKISALGGDIVLIGKTVDNQGALKAIQGTVGLIAGDDILLGQKNSDGSTTTVSVDPLATAAPGKVGVQNSGTIDSVTAELKAANGNLYALAIRNEGVINATTVKREGGRIWLTSDAGTIENTGTLNASAQVPGGRGGSVLVKSRTGSVVHAGKILAQGGQKGTGGNVEISAPSVQITGAVNTLAPGGQGGTFLLDPTTFTITAGATGADELTGAQVGGYIDTNGGYTINADNTITIDDGITWNSTNTLNLTTNVTGSKIFINAPITGTAGGLTIQTFGANDFITAGAKGSVAVANFILRGGFWDQGVGDGSSGLATDSALPSFSASKDFELQGTSTFLRAAGGDGSTANPYQITDVFGLQGIASPSNNLLGDNFVLNNNIDASGTASWNPTDANPADNAGFVPIGGTYNFAALAYNAYSGTFDGVGHTISGLTINRLTQTYVGLFGYTNGATIKSVGLVGDSVSGGSYVGGLVGYEDNSSISSSYATGAITGGAYYTGGLVGEEYDNSSIDHSYATGAVTGDSGSYYVGGLVGSEYSGSSISNSYATDAVTGSNGYIGGLVGFEIGSSISNSYASGSVSGNSDVGGLVGYEYGGSIRTSYATGAVVGDIGGSDVGGLVGLDNGSIHSSYATGAVTGGSAVGGLIGVEDGSSINTSYATGTVSGSKNVGGLIGAGMNGTIADSYYSTTNNGSLAGIGFADSPAPSITYLINGVTTSAADVTGFTTAQLTNSKNYDSAWNNFALGAGNFGINGYNAAGQINQGLPYLQAQYPTTGQIAIKDQTTTYNGTATGDGFATNGSSAYTINGTYTGTPTLVSNGTNKDVGTTNLINVDPTSLALTGSDAVEVLDGTESFSPRPITANLSIGGATVSKTYDGDNTLTSGNSSNYADLALTLSNTEVGDLISVTPATFGYSSTDAAPGLNVTASGLGLSGASVADYTLVSTTATASGAGEITAKTVTATLTDPTNSTLIKTYDGNNTVTSGINNLQLTLAGLINSGDATVNATGYTYSGSNANAAGPLDTVMANGLTLSGGHAQDYTLSANTASTEGGVGLINPATVIITPGNNQTVTYGDASHTFTFSSNYTPLGSSDPAAFTYTGALGGYAQYTNNVTTNGISNTITLSNLASANTNYVAQLAATPVEYTVTPYHLTVAATDISSTPVVYGAGPNFGYTAPTLNNDSLGEANYTTSAGLSTTKYENVTTATSTYTADFATVNPNYVIDSSTPAAYVITPKPVSVALTGAVSKTYDGTTAVTGGDAVTAPLTLTTSDFISNDVVALGSTGYSYSDANIGSKVITANQVNLNGNDAGDYQLGTISSTATGTITPAVLDYIAAPVTTTTDVPLPTFTGTVTGFVNGEKLDTATTGTLSFATLTTGTTAGSFAIDGRGLSAPNYTFVQDPNNATALLVNPAPTTLPTTPPAPENSLLASFTIPFVLGQFSGQNLVKDVSINNGSSLTFDLYLANNSSEDSQSPSGEEWKNEFYESVQMSLSPNGIASGSSYTLAKKNKQNAPASDSGASPSGMVTLLVSGSAIAQLFKGQAGLTIPPAFVNQTFKVILTSKVEAEIFQAILHEAATNSHSGH